MLTRELWEKIQNARAYVRVCVCVCVGVRVRARI